MMNVFFKIRLPQKNKTRKKQEKQQNSNYSLADASCQFFKVIWWAFSPWFLKHLSQNDWLDTVKLVSRWLRFRDFAGHSIRFGILTDCLFLKYCSHFGDVWLHYSVVGCYPRVWHGVAKPFLPQGSLHFGQISYFTASKAPPNQHTASTMVQWWYQSWFLHLCFCSVSHICSFGVLQ